MDECYKEFCRYIDSLTNLNDFKSHPSFQYMLEHVSYTQGIEYLEIIKNKVHLSDDIIKGYCTLNDKIGGGHKFNYDFITTSPSNLRYILHSHLILNHIKSLNMDNIDIVEVGCGYGGLCLAINYLSPFYDIKINSYNLIDLSAPLKLQELYLSQHTLNFKTTFNNASEFGNNIDTRNLFLISNYCFSEISDENQKKYILNLFPKVLHGFMAWNNIPFYNFGFICRDEVEYPLTGPFNKYIYF